MPQGVLSDPIRLRSAFAKETAMTTRTTQGHGEACAEQKPAGYIHNGIYIRQLLF